MTEETDPVKSVEGTIVKTVERLCLEWPNLERDELYQQSYLICIQLYWNKWDPKRSSWNSFLTSQLYGRLKQYIVKYTSNSLSHFDLPHSLPKDEEECPRVKLSELLPDKMGVPDRIAQFRDKLACLSSDAHHIAEMVLDPTEYVNCFDHEGHPAPPREVRTRLRDKLKVEEQWSWPRIRSAMQELRESI